MNLPKPPAEVPVISRVNAMAPKMQDAVLAIVKEMADAGHNAKVFETLRTEERQAFLYGFGRKYDDGRGTVTKVEDKNGKIPVEDMEKRRQLLLDQ